MLLAQIQTDVLGRSLLFAAVLVSPYAFYKWRQVQAVRRARAERIAAANAPPPPTRPGLEGIIDEISRLGSERVDGATTVTVPREVTVGGSDAPPELIDALVRDALRRSGMVATAELDTAEGRVFEVHPVRRTS